MRGGLGVGFLFSFGVCFGFGGVVGEEGGEGGEGGIMGSWVVSRNDYANACMRDIVSPLDLLKNPMILIAVVGLGFVVGMPYLMDSSMFGLFLCRVSCLLW